MTLDLSQAIHLNVTLLQDYPLHVLIKTLQITLSFATLTYSWTVHFIFLDFAMRSNALWQLECGTRIS